MIFAFRGGWSTTSIATRRALHPTRGALLCAMCLPGVFPAGVGAGDEPIGDLEGQVGALRDGHVRTLGDQCGIDRNPGVRVVNLDGAQWVDHVSLPSVASCVPYPLIVTRHALDCNA